MRTWSDKREKAKEKRMEANSPPKEKKELNI
jgi:hypothetical protein